MLKNPRASPPIACPTRSRTEEHPCWLGRADIRGCTVVNNITGCGVFAGNSVWSTSERLGVEVLTIGAIQVHFLSFPSCRPTELGSDHLTLKVKVYSSWYVKVHVFRIVRWISSVWRLKNAPKHQNCNPMSSRAFSAQFSEMGPISSFSN